MNFAVFLPFFGCFSQKKLVVLSGCSHNGGQSAAAEPGRRSPEPAEGPEAGEGVEPAAPLRAIFRFPSRLFRSSFGFCAGDVSMVSRAHDLAVAGSALPVGICKFFVNNTAPVG